MEPKDVPLDSLPPSRLPTSDPRVAAMVDVIRKRGRLALPPISLTPDGGIIDGHHRIAAHRIAGETVIRAYQPRAQSAGPGNYMAAHRWQMNLPIVRARSPDGGHRR